MDIIHLGFFFACTTAFWKLDLLWEDNFTEQESRKTDVGSDGKYLRVIYLYKASSIGKVYWNEKFLLIKPFFIYTFFGRM